MHTTASRHNNSDASNTNTPPAVPEESKVPYSSLTVGVPKEIYQHERRVAITPANVKLLKKKGFRDVIVERDAGVAAQFMDADYASAGATLVSKEEIYANSDITLKVRPPLLDQESGKYKQGSTMISFLYPAQNKPIVDALASRGHNALAVSSTFRRLS